MKYYVIAGEASGDLHGSNLIKQLKVQDPSAQIKCWGGDLMQATGAHLVKHYRDLAFMGFTEVIKNLPTILGNLRFCKEDIISYQPDAIILIDYPGFNLRIAEWAKKQGIKVIYYIAPQVWAWKANRVKKMKTCIDLMLCILPFEKAYFKNNWNWDVHYVGHPLIEVIEKFKSANQSDIKPIIALLPGSRKQEIAKKLPIMLSVADKFPQYEFVVAQAPGQDDAFYEPFLEGQQNVKVVKDGTYHLLSASTAALVTSGTATLETALFGVPEIVCYKGSAISYQIARRLIKIKFISLVNLIMDKEIVKELIQDELNTANLARELQFITSNPQKISELKSEYQQLYKKLAEGGHASKNAASLISNLLQNK
ncbi:lipid-A-disaccharide synthase [Sediminibacterium sp. TEGAF015]|uniref:lipid-A-disaccharide synthase n=1 Tax=Sediminibacterium sp. TEGAF015 TaxID=575378 RepID=UPI0021FA8616|nr:lipid-A-disaccharide synthase [Sediminibacterium sp. TEGAF015]BDQ11911.1 lipid-A-disaccharide synthase [Sediminibacterium sp. TEGAF015]